MKRKIDQLVELIELGDYKGAVAFANRFPELGQEKKDIERAHGAYTNPRFYKQLGYDIEELIQKGKAALHKRYAKYL